MKIALVHEFLNQLGGAERVLQNFLEIWPDATVHVILYDASKTNHEFEKYEKKISFLDKVPLTHVHPRLFLGLMPMAIESFKFDDYDVVLSDSSSFAKGIKTTKPHICYCHTPTRFLWTDQDYLGYQKYPGILKWFGKMILPWLKQWDYNVSQRPIFFIANSVNVQNRIKQIYKRSSVVIPPPVETEFFYPDGEKQDYFLVAGRLEPYKKIDLVIQAFNDLGLKLKVVGTGTILDQLKAKAKSNIEFMGRVSDAELRQLYSQAQAYIFPAVEDAGITILEAQSCATPVLAYGMGGALETIIPGRTGEFFPEQTVEAIKAAVRNFNPKKYDARELTSNAALYDKESFQKKIKDYVDNKYANRA